MPATSSSSTPLAPTGPGHCATRLPASKGRRSSSPPAVSGSTTASGCSTDKPIPNLAMPWLLPRPSAVHFASSVDPRRARCDLVTAPAETHPLDLLFAQSAGAADIEIPAGWGQGRATFGGLVAGVLIARGLGAYDLDGGTLRAATISFVAPVAAGPARLESELLRRGTSVTQVEIRLRQHDPRTGEDAVAAVMLASFGTERESSVELPRPTPTAIASPDADLPEIPYLPGIVPDFFTHVRMRLARGRVPFSGAPDGDLAGFMSFRNPPAAMTLPHVIALIDAWPPAPGQMLRRPAAMGTLTWTIEMLADPAAYGNQEWWYEVRTDAAHHGYAHSHATVFTPAGEAVAISRQTITIFG